MNRYTFYLKGSSNEDDQLWFSADWVGINENGFSIMTGPCNETTSMSDVIGWVNKDDVLYWTMKKSS